MFAKQTLLSASLVVALGGSAVADPGDEGRGYFQLGAGFSTDDLDQRRREGHVGLELLRGLLRDAGGALRVDSTPGRGTRVAVEVPVA